MTQMRRALKIYREQGLRSVLSLSFRYVVWSLAKPVIALCPNIYSIYVQLRGITGQQITDANPLKLLWVDPTRIVDCTEDDWPLERGLVEGGNWDRERAESKRETPSELKKCLQTGHIQKTSCDYFDLYRSLAEEGYLSQRELLQRAPLQTWNQNNEITVPVLNEINVDIGREGELLWRAGGRHRLAIARYLEIDQVAVLVCKRHKEWQKIRDEVRQSNTEMKRVTEYHEHPDLLDLS